MEFCAITCNTLQGTVHLLVLPGNLICILTHGITTIFPEMLLPLAHRIYCKKKKKKKFVWGGDNFDNRLLQIFFFRLPCTD